MTDMIKIAKIVRAACLEAALEAYEEAGISGLCAEGRWECAVQAISTLDLEEVLCQSGFSDGSQMEAAMDILAERLDEKLRQWNPEIAEQVRQRIAEIIELADQDALDVMRSRAVEQEVLDLLDES